MIRAIIILISISILFSCDSNEPLTPPSKEQIKSVFNNKKEIFKHLKANISKDHEGGYELRIDNKGIKPQILSTEKYIQYKRLLNSIPAQRVSKYEKETTFIIFSQGMVFAGCSTVIVHNPINEPNKPDWADPYQLVVLGDNWYAQTKCN